ncbi:MAG: hypothetical protein ACPGGK_01735 [Pikeienuella sp.]
MDPLTITVAVVVLILVGALVLLGGAIQTFRRQPVVAILCLIFLFPFWVLWAIVEIFLSRPK